MILPTKHVPAKQSLIGVGAVVLHHLEKARTLTDLWERLREVPEIGTFKRLVLTLDLLYAMGGVTIENGLIKRTSP